MMTMDFIAGQEEFLETKSAFFVRQEEEMAALLADTDYKSKRFLLDKLCSLARDGQRVTGKALRDCRRLKTGELLLTEESSDELLRNLAEVRDILRRQEEVFASLTGSAPSQRNKTSAASGVNVPTKALDLLSGIEFERLITLLLTRMGFCAGMTKASGDGGIDVVATSNHAVTGGRYLIQCKRYSSDSLIGAATVREFYGAVTADKLAVKGILITTSGFTAQAEEFAAALPIELIGRDRLQRLLQQYGLESDEGCPQGGSAESPADRASRMLDSAIELHEQGKCAEAIKLLREATQLQPEDPNLWFWLSLFYRSVSLHDDQIAASREAVRLKPDFGDAWYCLGGGLSMVGELDPAITAFTNALADELLPPDRQAHSWAELGWIYKKMGDKVRAISALQNAVKAAPDDVSLRWQLGMFLYLQGEYTEAISPFREVLQIDPNHVDSWEWLCHVYRKLGDNPRMQTALIRLEQLDAGAARNFRRNFP
jgi:tetratricopeptide (TPR) repeat protein